LRFDPELARPWSIELASNLIGIRLGSEAVRRRLGCELSTAPNSSAEKGN
jgi:hypothetical protein